MNIFSTTIIPITKAREKLGNLAEQAAKGKPVILTKDGTPKVALVNVSYLAKLEEEVKRLYKKTFIDKKLVKYTRIFNDKEIKEWEKEDAL